MIINTKMSKIDFVKHFLADHHIFLKEDVIQIICDTVYNLSCAGGDSIKLALDIAKNAQSDPHFYIETSEKPKGKSRTRKQIDVYKLEH